MNRNHIAGHGQDDLEIMGTLESDDCCGAVLNNFNTELSPRFAFESRVPSASKAEWARPKPHPQDFVFGCLPTDVPLGLHDSNFIDSGVMLSCPQGHSRVHSFSTSSKSAASEQIGCGDKDSLGLNLSSLRISEEFGEILERRETKKEECLQQNDVEYYRISWDLIFEQDEDGDTQLHIAILMDSQVDFALSIINLCQNAELLDLQNCLHQTALHLAVVRRQIQIVQALVSRNTSLFVCDGDGNTPLHLACQMGYTEAVNALSDRFRTHLEKSFLLEIIHHKNYEGLTCCHLSAMSQVPDNLFHLTQDCGADINIQEGKRGMTVLHMAAISNNETLVSFLLAQPYIDLNELTYDGWTALDLSTGRHLTHIEKLLRSAGAIKTEDNVITSSDSETSEMEDVETDDLILGYQSFNTQ